MIECVLLALTLPREAQRDQQSREHTRGVTKDIDDVYMIRTHADQEENPYRHERSLSNAIHVVSSSTSRGLIFNGVKEPVRPTLQGGMQAQGRLLRQIGVCVT